MIRVSNSPKSGFTWKGVRLLTWMENHTPPTGFKECVQERKSGQEAIKSPRAVLRLPVPELIGNYCLGVSCDRLRAVATPREHVRMYGWCR